ncbi:AraC-like transcriptional regulator QhpR [Pseudomonas alkylphenolica]|uniref:AraC family transcriptional regulator n=1 Tax=Pseudomonas alkylphenolica TaxID=237609 RepID=A0A077FD27_9PSED|nr:AraC family transcriptional regulator [Pseudomonas alkylphenolica]AIL61754.1 AraC family transcriptional regulator [Pseudomonas alkylphenolica]
MTAIVRGSALLGFAPFATEQGLHASQLLSEVGLPTDAQDHLDCVIPYSQFNALLELGTKRSGNPLFGLEFGLHQGVAILGNLLYVIQNASTVGEALKALRQYFHIHNSGAEIHLELFGGQARLSYEITVGDVTSVRPDVELALAVGQQLMQSLLGRRWRPSALQFRHSAMAAVADYRRLLGISPRFDCPYNAWVFDAALLEIPLSAADEHLQQLVKQHIEELSQLSLQELPAFVQKLLRDMLPHGKVKIEQVAAYMMISQRSLQRYLLEENTSFQELLDQTRQSLSSRYLCDSSINMTQVAGLLGYADLSAFSRAFTRWNGLSPRQWKKLHRQELRPTSSSKTSSREVIA